MNDRDLLEQEVMTNIKLRDLLDEARERAEKAVACAINAEALGKAISEELVETQQRERDALARVKELEAAIREDDWEHAIWRSTEARAEKAEAEVERLREELRVSAELLDLARHGSYPKDLDAWMEARSDD